MDEPRTGPHPGRPADRVPRAWTLLVVVGLAGCGTGHDEDRDALGGFGLPTQPSAEPFPGGRQELRGTLHVEDDGCFTWDDGADERRWIVWPEGADADGDRVLLPEPAVQGSVLVGTGARIDADDLPGWQDEDSYIRAFGGFCDAAGRGVVVLDAVALG